jgi:hypothetical protein
MTRIYNEFRVTETVLLLERHLPGKSFLGFRGYSLGKVRYKRGFEGYFKVEYSPLQGSVEVKQATFGFGLSFLTSDFLEMEKDRRPQSPPLIPRRHQNLAANVNRIFIDPSGLRYANYHRVPKSMYHDEQAEKYRRILRYQQQPWRSYMPEQARIREQALDRGQPT